MAARHVAMAGFVEQMNCRRGVSTRGGLGDVIVPLAVTLFSLSIGPVLAWWYQADDQAVAVKARLVLPARIGDWRAGDENRDAWRPDIQGADSADGKVYAKAGTGTVELYAFHYQLQKQDKEAINDLNRVADGKEWRVVHSRQRQIGAADAGISVEETLIRSAADREKLVWRWYSVNGTTTGNRLIGKIQNIIGILTGDPTITVMVVAAEHHEYERASEVLARFVTEGMESIESLIHGMQ